MVSIIGPRKRSPFAPAKVRADDAPLPPSLVKSAPAALNQFTAGAASRGRSINYYETTPYDLWVAAGSPVATDALPYLSSTITVVRGDWLYVAPDSAYTCRANLLNKSTGDSPGVLLKAGSIFRMPFTGIVLFTQLATGAISPPTDSPPVAYPEIRLYYGEGECPFEATEPRGSRIIINSSSSAPTSAGQNFGYRVVEGQKISVNLNYSKLVPGGGGNAADINSHIDLTNLAGTTVYATLVPTTQSGHPREVGPAAATVVYSHDYYAPFVIPRGVSQMLVRVDDIINIGGGLISVSPGVFLTS